MDHHFKYLQQSTAWYLALYLVDLIQTSQAEEKLRHFWLQHDWRIESTIQNCRDKGLVTLNQDRVAFSLQLMKWQQHIGATTSKATAMKMGFPTIGFSPISRSLPPSLPSQTKEDTKGGNIWLHTSQAFGLTASNINTAIENGHG